MIIAKRSSTISSYEFSNAVIKFKMMSVVKNISMEYKNIEYPKSSSLISGNARSNGVTAACTRMNNVCKISQNFLTLSSGYNKNHFLLFFLNLAPFSTHSILLKSSILSYWVGLYEPFI